MEENPHTPAPTTGAGAAPIEPRRPRPATSGETAAPIPAEQPRSASGSPSEDSLVLRPAVKYAGLALLVALLLGAEYATYRSGYASGFRDGTSSGEVDAAVNAAAVANLTRFMQAASADDATLLASIANRERELSWIRDPDVRREAEWTLAQSALDRGLGAEASQLLASLFRSAPSDAPWARRALAVARAMSAENHVRDALAYYRFAASRFAASQDAEGQLTALNEMAVLLAASSSGSEETISALDALQDEAAGLGEAGRLLRADILAYMGRQYRDRGDKTAALRCFEEALDGTDPSKVSLASAAVCYGQALLARGRDGDAARAEKLLREGVSRLGDSPADVTYLVTALRDLARLEQERGESDAALALLYRAEGAATNRIQPQSSFWVCLYDQRGWVNFVKGAHEAALADFRKALACQAHDSMLLQPLEGAGRCAIVLGDAASAVRDLGRAAELRATLAPQDATALGRVQLLLGQAQDMQGDASAAAEAYGKAADLLAADASKEAAENRLAALMGRAYALSQLEQWQEAAALWESLQPLAAGNANRETEVEQQLAFCRNQGADAPAAGAQPAATPATRPSRRSSRRIRR